VPVRSVRKRSLSVPYSPFIEDVCGPAPVRIENALHPRDTERAKPDRRSGPGSNDSGGVPSGREGSTLFDSDQEAPLRKRLLTCLALVTSGVGSASCGAEPTALTVADVTFTEAELLGLSESRRIQLAEITAFGLATARDELPVKLAPILEEANAAALLRQFAAERVLVDAGVDDEQLRAHYLTNPKLELTVRHVLFFSERWRPAPHRAAARKKAVSAIARLEAGEEFPEVAAELSEEPGAEGRQGLLQPGREGSWVSEFWTAAFALEPGEISPVTETQYGFHVLRLEDRQIVSFEEARPTVAAEVAELIGSLVGSLEDFSDGVSIEAARAAGIVVPEAELAAIIRDFDDRTLRWNTALGFAPGLTSTQVKNAARAALGATEQLATIARRELGELAPILRAAYPITFGDGG
jgi:hypothetical protein